MINTRDINIAMIAAVARHLGELREKVVFVGGCVSKRFLAIFPLTGRARRACRCLSGGCGR